MKKRISVRAAALILCTVIAAVAAIGVTVAYLFDVTPSLEEKFDPVEVACRVLSTVEEHPTNVTVKNVGDVEAYIRATVVVTWVSDASGSTYGGAPVPGIHYTVTAGEAGWVQGSDGFHYCTAPIAPDAKTPILFGSIDPVEGKAPEGYHLSVRILASGIQSTPVEAINAAWRTVTVAEDGTLSPQ